MKWAVAAVALLAVAGGGGYYGYSRHQAKLEQERIEAQKLAETQQAEAERKAREEEGKRLAEEQAKAQKAEVELESMPQAIPFDVWQAHGGTQLPPTTGTWRIVDAQAPGASAWSAAALQQTLGKKLLIQNGYIDTPFYSCNPCSPEVDSKIYSTKAFLANNPTFELRNIPGKFVVSVIYTFKPSGKTLQIVSIVGTNTAYIGGSGAYFVLERQTETAQTQQKPTVETTPAAMPVAEPTTKMARVLECRQWNMMIPRHATNLEALPIMYLHPDKIPGITRSSSQAGITYKLGTKETVYGAEVGEFTLADAEGNVEQQVTLPKSIQEMKPVVENALRVQFQKDGEGWKFKQNQFYLMLEKLNDKTTRLICGIES